MIRHHRIYRLLVLLLLGVFSVVSLTLLYARRQPLASQLDMFNFQSCALPCWNGIVPGTSTVGEALALLRREYSASTYFISPTYVVINDSRWYTVSRSGDRMYLSIAFNDGEDLTTQTDATIITQITILTNPNAKLTLADWHHLLGQPQGLAISVTESNWIKCYNPNLLYYGKGTRLTLFNEADPYMVQSPEIPATRLDIFSAIESIYPPFARVDWHGLSAANKNRLLQLLRS